MIVRTRAIVLNHLKYGETGLIATLYTEEQGRCSVLAKGVYGKKNNIRSGLFQPLSLLEVTANFDHRRDLHNLREASLSVPLSSIPFDPVKNCIALFLSEVLYKSLKEEVANPDLFHFLFHSMQILDLCTKGTANFHLIFLMQLSKYLGFSPRYHVPDVRESTLPAQNVLLDPPGAGWPGVDAEVSGWFSRLFQSGFEQMDTMKMDHHTRNKLVNNLLQWYGLEHEGCLRMKSLPVLTSLFSS